MIKFDLRNDIYDSLITLKKRVMKPENYVNSKSSDLMVFNDWFSYKGKLYYFKYKNIFEELFMSELAKEFKLRCVDFSLVYNKEYDLIGLSSENFRTFDKEFLTYYDYFDNYGIPFPKGILELLKYIDFIGECNVHFGDLLPLIVMDIFSGQRDRENYNVILEKKDGNIFLSPLTDNEYILDKNYLYRYSSVLGDFLLIDKDSEITFEHEESFEILKYSVDFFRCMVKCLDIDINSIIDRTCEKYGMVISDYEKGKILDYFNSKKHLIEYTLSKSLSM